jgi:aryl-alcohol dehydrogenase-like predicted oxidoreductase
VRGNSHYGASDDEQAIGTIRRALDVGMNRSIRPMPIAYCNGHNEMLVGRAIAGMHQQAFVATKFGIVFDESETGTDLPTGWGSRSRSTADHPTCARRSIPVSSVCLPMSLSLVRALRRSRHAH